ncbi:ACIDIC LEUCINE-RICH NUCLEAR PHOSPHOPROTEIN 32-RELATED PROTEIN 2 [Salix purpurea]|uniref:ACIDIC LEUCINE-RICH NUCLEAR PHOSPHOPROTEIN 32-RELATED PROTEIN 2 n=1 Tax=Salix purpurea TaxID=77065 RepID=A0A9Q0V1P3_SALPP|nr:ACIDIC LEUCINE-RICH NUCLEAR PHOSPHOPROTEIN 32-RELATED PROTEIN 2 [Salix purpurea]
MDEIWDRAVETALEGQTDNLAVRALTLDGAVKCIQGRLPAAPSLFEKFENLQHLSIASIGVSTLEQFPRLGNLEKLILSDNRISGGLEFLVEAGLESLRDLDLSNNRIQYIEDLAPLAKLRLVSLDLYECPVTRVKDYRASVFGLISSLKYLDKMDAEENERPESDDDDEEEEEAAAAEDPGSGEVDGEEERPFRMNNGHSEVGEGIVDEGEESEADEEEVETGGESIGVGQNGFRVEGEEEEVDNDEGDLGEPESAGRLTSTEGEIDGHEHGEDDGEEDDIGETGDEDQGIENGGEFDDEEDGEEEVFGLMACSQNFGEFGDLPRDEDSDEGYLVQPVGQAEVHQPGVSDLEPVNVEDDPEGVEEVDDDDELQMLPSSSHLKRKRDEDEEDSEDEDDVVEYTKSSSKKHL